ncbi:MAG: hypothetical protein DME34_11085 [Verrucomicrobia bacterium]|nr:MAG: hypothetical protein DME34_11085 [Verrucomicrobiota bacterium]
MAVARQPATPAFLHRRVVGLRRLLLRREHAGEPIAVSSPDQPAVGALPLIGSKAERWIFLLLGLLPLAAIVRLISKYAVNVPWGDEWSLVPLIRKSYEHQLTLTDLFRQHNEHRIIIPKLIYVGFAQWTHWNVVAEMFFSVLLCCAISAGIYLLLERTLPGPARKRLFLWALINLLIFAPVQAENWLWGFQLQMFIPNLCLVGCLVLLTSRLGDAHKMSGAALLATIATFSFGGGVLLWPVIALYLLFTRKRARWLTVWSAGFVAVALVYFVGYERASIPGPELGNRFDHLVYFTSFLGIALSRSSLSTNAAITTALIGAIAFLLFLIAGCVFFKLPLKTRVSAGPWLALAAYATGSAALAACMRVSAGPQQALNSRYATISLNLYVGLIGMVAIAARSARAAELPGRLARSIAAAEAPVFTAILTLSAMSFPAGIDHMEILQRLRLQGAAHLQFCQVISPSEKLPIDLMIGASLPAMVRDADLLDRLHLLDPPLRRSAILHDGEDRPQRSTAEFGRSDNLVQKDADVFEMNGWCFLRERGEPAPCVVLAYQADQSWVAIGLTEPHEKRPDIMKEMKSKQYLDSGWRAFIHRKLLPTGTTRVSAWAFDPAAGEAYKLPGDFTLPAR